MGSVFRKTQNPLTSHHLHPNPLSLLRCHATPKWSSSFCPTPTPQIHSHGSQSDPVRSHQLSVSPLGLPIPLGEKPGPAMLTHPSMSRPLVSFLFPLTHLLPTLLAAATRGSLLVPESPQHLRLGVCALAVPASGRSAPRDLEHPLSAALVSPPSSPSQ